MEGLVTVQEKRVALGIAGAQEYFLLDKISNSLTLVFLQFDIQFDQLFQVIYCFYFDMA
ncbi:hypothetical protein YSY22_12730 [Brevibacillus formosus]